MLSTTLDELKKKGLWVVGVDAAGERFWTDFDYTGPVALVFGGEHRVFGVLFGSTAMFLCASNAGKIASLNVSVAAGVVLYEVVRQRRRSSIEPN